MFQGHARTQPTAQHIGHGQIKRDVPPHMAFEGEQQQSRQVAGGVEHFGMGRRVQKVIAQHAHQGKHQKTAGAGAKKTVVKAQHQAQHGKGQRLGAARPTRCMVAPHVFARQGVDEHRQQHQGQGAAQKCGVDFRHRPRTQPSPDQGCTCPRSDGRPAQINAAAELPGGPRRAPHRCAFVDAQQAGGVGQWVGGEQGRHQDQATAAHNRVDETGQGRRHRNQQHIHGHIVLAVWAQKKAPPQRCLGIEHLGGVSRDVSPRTLGLGVNAQTSDANVSPE